MKYLLTIVLLFSCSQAIAAQTESFYTGNALLELCEAYLDGGTSANIAKGNTCASYVAGIDDAHSLFVDWLDMEQSWCAPKNVNMSQLVRVVTKHLQENPQKLHKSGNSLIGNALIIAFPCE